VTDGPYILAHGDVWHVDADGTPGGAALGLNRRHICRGSERMAVCYDGSTGALHKHGAERGVEAWAAKTRKSFADADMPDLADDLIVVVFPPTAGTIEELNASIACTGRVLRIADRLAEIAESIPRSEWPAAYPR
jgi:hypothetical protein